MLSSDIKMGVINFVVITEFFILHRVRYFELLTNKYIQITLKNFPLRTQYYTTKLRRVMNISGLDFSGLIFAKNFLCIKKNGKKPARLMEISYLTIV